MQEEQVKHFQEAFEREATRAEPPARGSCPHCGGRGFTRSQKDGYDFITRCQCRRERDLLQTIERTGIPQKFWNCTLDTKPADPNAKFMVGTKRVRGSEALEVASRERALNICTHMRQRYIDFFIGGERKDELFGLLLYGDCGLGKTRLAASLLLDLVRAGLTTVRFIEYNELFKQIRFTYNKDGPSYQGLFEGLIQTSVLVIDDFGLEVSGDHVWVLDNIGYIINERYVKNRPTILTTNFWRPLDNETSVRAQEQMSKFIDAASWEQRKIHEQEEQSKRQERSIRRQEEAWEKVSYRLRSRISEMCLQVKLEGRDYRARLAEKRDHTVKLQLDQG